MNFRKNFVLYLLLVILISLVWYLIFLSKEVTNIHNYQQKRIDDNSSEIEELKKLKPIKSEGTVKVVQPTIVNEPSFPGKDGENGKPGSDGVNGSDGISAYQTAVKNGFIGTEEEWLFSLKGTDGRTPIFDCIGGKLATKYSGDFAWKLSKIVCEVAP